MARNTSRPPTSQQQYEAKLSQDLNSYMKSQQKATCGMLLLVASVVSIVLYLAIRHVLQASTLVSTVTAIVVGPFAGLVLYAYIREVRRNRLQGKVIRRLHENKKARRA